MNLRIEPKLNTTVAHTQPNSSSEGFTLVEVVVVVAIIGVIALIGIPAFQEGLQKSAVKNLSRSIMFHMKEARVTAMAESRKIQISFDAYSYTYDSYTCNRCKKINVLYADFSSSIKVTTNIVPPIFKFSSRGTIKPGSIMVTSGNYTSKVTVNSIGRAYVK